MAACALHSVMEICVSNVMVLRVSIYYNSVYFQAYIRGMLEMHIGTIEPGELGVLTDNRVLKLLNI